MGFDLGGIEAPYLLAEAMMGLVEDVSFAMIENHAHALPTSRFHARSSCGASGYSR